MARGLLLWMLGVPATADTIRRVKGMADLSSKCMVAKTALDSNGFYASDSG
jgi:hypothetical protein